MAALLLLPLSLAFALASGAAAAPNTCQPRAEHPFMPIFHIIGNVSAPARRHRATALSLPPALAMASRTLPTGAAPSCSHADPDSLTAPAVTSAQVTTDATDKVTQVEAINDVSSVILYKGIYHIFHQWCRILQHFPQHRL